MDNLVTRLQVRLVELRLEANAARQAIHRAEAQAQKERQPVPRHQMEQMVERVKAADREVASCAISLEAVSKYPPLRTFG